MVRCKAGDTWGPLEEWGVRAKRRQILEELVVHKYVERRGVKPNAKGSLKNGFAG